ncbi:retrovirus-related pol polyprotein from transposon TNT 1-94 [Tanacetum coccineum]
MYKLDPVILAPKVNNNREARKYYLKYTMEQAAILREVVEQAKSRNPLDSASYSACMYVKLIQELLVYVRDTCPDIHKSSEKLVAVFNSIGYKWKPTRRTFTLVGNACPLTRITATNKMPLMVPIPLEVVAPKHVVTRVYTRRPKISKSVQNSNPKVAKSMTANRMEPGTSRGSDTSVAPSSPSLIDCRLFKLFCGIWTPDASSTSPEIALSSPISDMMASSPICLLSKATKTKSWLWHRCLSHLNFGAINHLARRGLVHGLPRLKFEKDHLCSACAMGKSKKQSYKPKSEDTNQEKLYLLHMDLCGSMRVASVKFLASKDEAPDFIIKFQKMIQVRLNATVRDIRTDNGTEFVNQTLENLGKLQAKADIGIFIGYAPKKKAYRIYNRRTQKIIETIHVDFDDPTAMAYEQSSLEPALHEMTPATPSSGLVPNPPPSAPFIPPSRHEWDLVFQPVFDEFFFHPTSVASPVPAVEAPALVELTGTPSSTSVDQDAPSPSTSQTTHVTPRIGGNTRRNIMDIITTQRCLL